MTKYLAYRMCGFLGLTVTERVEFDPGRSFCWRPTGEHSEILRIVPSDGELFDTYAECLAACRAANIGNPFWKEPAQ